MHELRQNPVVELLRADAKERRRCEAKINRSDVQERPLELTT